MNVCLLYRGRPVICSAITDDLLNDRFRDLQLSGPAEAMAAGDSGIYSLCCQLLNTPLQNQDDILYRQNILKDCLARPDAVKKIYRLCETAGEERSRCRYRLDSPYLPSVYSGALELLNISIRAIAGIRGILDRISGSFQSEGLLRLSGIFRREFDDSCLSRVCSLLDELGGSSEIVISAALGSNLEGISYVLRRNQNRLKWLMAPSFTLAERDTKGEKDLDCRRERALFDAAEALAQAAEGLGEFLKQLKLELGFYLGALNLYDALSSCGMPVCFPEFCSENKREWKELYDGNLALLQKGKVTGNDLNAERRLLFIITGANQGGKTTFLRSAGQCQLMAQCGLFVCASACRLPIRNGIFTHFKREEKQLPGSGRLDEELERMSRIADHLQKGSLLLMNESFSSTSEKEGSEILKQITQALLERKIEIFSVTHLFTFAEALSDCAEVQYLKALRNKDGTRSFRLQNGMPSRTAYGEDIYRKIFCIPQTGTQKQHNRGDSPQASALSSCDPADQTV